MGGICAVFEKCCPQTYFAIIPCKNCHFWLNLFFFRWS